LPQIKPIRPWRYRRKLASEIGKLTSPLFDVVSEKQRQALYETPYNSIHLSVPSHGPKDAARLLDQWKTIGIILRDHLPGIYVYYQYFKLEDSGRQFCRKGFVCNIRIHDWNEKMILRHENTIPSSVNDRTDLLRETELNVSPTFGLYTDPAFELERHMDDAISDPIYETEDYQGVRDVLGVIHDASVIQKFVRVLSGKTIILADGHHRYEGSLIYQRERRSTNPHHHGNEGYNFHMMYLCNTEGGGLKILPTHRLISGLAKFSPADFIVMLQEDFDVQLLSEQVSLADTIAGKQWTFGIVLQNERYCIQLKPGAFETLPWPFPEVVKKLDLTVLHYFILEKVLKIPGRLQRQSTHIRFERSLEECKQMITTGEAQIAIITNPVTIDDVKEVCKSGSVMPQKSTYFYPKVMCGFLFGSIREEEFQLPAFSPF